MKSDLIERLKKEAEHLSRLALNTNNKVTKHHDDLRAAITALSPALPDDVAKFIESLKDPTENTPTRREAADLLERQVRDIAAYERYEKTMGKVVPELQQRIEELVDMHQECSKSLTTQVKRACKAEKRIEQLEAALKIIESEIMPEIPNSKGWQYTPAEVARAALQENE